MLYHPPPIPPAAQVNVTGFCIPPEADGALWLLLCPPEFVFEGEPVFPPVPHAVKTINSIMLTHPIINFFNLTTPRIIVFKEQLLSNDDPTNRHITARFLSFLMY
jgi:hypothetical protein